MLGVADETDTMEGHAGRSSPDGSARAVDHLARALWTEPEADVRRALLATRAALFASLDPAQSARGWLAVAHALVVTDAEAARRAAEEAVARCRADRPDLLLEARTLAALLGSGRPPDQVLPGLGGRVLTCAARFVEEPGVDSAGHMIRALEAVPDRARVHATRWIGLAERSVGLVPMGARGGRVLWFDTQDGSIGVEGYGTVALGRSRRLFDLLLAVALWPELEREALFEHVWGHPWRGASSKNSLHASMSRARACVPGLPIEFAGGYRIEGKVTLYLRGPGPTLARETVEGTPLVGRQQDLKALRQALQPGTWVALWGPPGSGKSRLAREVARNFGERVRFVELRGVSTRSGLQAEVARVLGVGSDELLPALEARATLLVLDDLDELEHVDLAGLLRPWSRSGRVTVLTTQRHRVPADAELSLPPLSPSEGAQVVLAQAPDLDPDWALTLARELDGLPLALEIAGRQVQRLGVDDVRELVLRSLREGRGPLAAAMQLSWQGLTDAQRSALARLAALDLGLPAGAANAVLGELAPTLDELSDRALVQRGHEVVLLRSVRHFALRHLDPPTRASAVRALAGWALGLSSDQMPPWSRLLVALPHEAAEHAPELCVPLSLAVLPGLQEAVAPDALVALLDRAHDLAGAEQRAAVEVAQAEQRFAAGDTDGTRAILDRVQDGLDGRLLAKALLLRGKLARTARDPQTDTSLDLAVEACTGDDLREALTVRGFHRILTQRLVEGRADLERACRISEDLGPAATARARANLGLIATLEGRLGDGERLFAEAAPALEAGGQARILRHTLHNMAFVRHRLGHLDAAHATALQALALHEQLGQPMRAASTCLGLGSIALDRGDLEQALRWAYRAQAQGQGAERAAWVVREAEGLAAAAHLELGQTGAARALVEQGEGSISCLMARAMLAAADRDVGATEEALAGCSELLHAQNQGTTGQAATHAVHAVLRQHLGLLGAEDHLRRARETLEPEEGTARCIVQAAEHKVAGAPLVDPVPPSHLARMLLRYGS